jgi:hypothetical protein
VPPEGSRLIMGWPAELNRSHQFKITSYPDSAVAKLNKPNPGLGIISVSVVESWEKGKERKGKRSASGPLGSGLGEPVDTPLQMRERTFGDTLAVIHLRYMAK